MSARRVRHAGLFQLAVREETRRMVAFWEHFLKCRKFTAGKRGVPEINALGIFFFTEHSSKFQEREGRGMFHVPLLAFLCVISLIWVSEQV